MTNIHVIALTTLVLAGCAGRVDNSVRKVAAPEFQCEAANISVQETDIHSGFYKVYRAHGCDKTHLYTSRCNLITCQTYVAGVVDKRAPVDDPADEEYRGTYTLKKDAPKPRAELKIRNACDKDAMVFDGPDPAGKGNHRKLGPGRDMNKSARAEDKFWLVDPAHADQGLDSYTVVPGQNKVWIDESCTKFTTTKPGPAGDPAP